MTLSASAEMPRIKTGLKISDPRPTPATGGTAVLNNQTFSVPSSVLSQNAVGAPKGGAIRTIRTGVARAVASAPARTNDTAVLNNQTFTGPKSIVLSPAEARRARVLSVLPRRNTAATAPRNNNNSPVLTNTTFSVPTSIVVSGKPEPRITGVVSGRRLPNAAPPRCPGGAWTC